MVRWLYNSDGDPVAFVSGENVYSYKGDFVGKLYPDKKIWNGDYIGEIFADDRLIFDTTRLYGRKSLPSFPGLPGFAPEPAFKGPFTIPLGYQDVQLD